MFGDIVNDIMECLTSDHGLLDIKLEVFQAFELNNRLGKL